MLLLGRHGDALIEGFLRRLELAKLQQALPLSRWAPVAWAAVP
ncbi:hypothetical protein C3B79_1761 [Aeromonas hydrophila]|nr:hypothetical protein C3B79_1761 [Aeromonas hydrophila]